MCELLFLDQSHPLYEGCDIRYFGSLPEFVRRIVLFVSVYSMAV